MLIRREALGDVAAIRDVVVRAFPTPMEADLVEELRADEGWIPALSMVAEIDGEVVGHVVCTRADLDGAPVLGLGPLERAARPAAPGVGLALMHAMLGAADALGEPLVVLLGNPPTTSGTASAPPPTSGSSRRIRSGASISRRGR